MSFQEFSLHNNLKKALQNLGYHEPTPIQAQAIPRALTGKDLIGCAQTGTGKTAAFALPILNRLQQRRRGNSVRALILTPTRELAAQIKDVLHDLSMYTNLNTAAIYGGVAVPPQQRALRRPADIVVATPGRLLDHMNNRVGRFDGLEFLVLDEADRLMDMGFLPDVKRIVSKLPRRRQTLLFSATMPKEIVKLSEQILHEPDTVQIGRQSAPAEGVSQKAYPVPQHLKADLVATLLGRIDSDATLIFTRTKARTDRLARQLKQRGFHKTARIHGDRTQSQRLRAIDGLRSGRYRILVATDVAARGLDVDGITHVINFDVPNSPEDYVHRIGRTARAKAIGEALTLVAPAEEGSLVAIQQLTKSRIPEQTVPGFDYGRMSAAPPRSQNRPAKQPWSGAKNRQGRRRARRSVGAARG